MIMFEILMVIGLILIIIAIIAIIKLNKTIIEYIELDKPEMKQKQFNREHISMSKTDFREYFKRQNRCLR